MLFFSVLNVNLPWSNKSIHYNNSVIYEAKIKKRLDQDD